MTGMHGSTQNIECFNTDIFVETDPEDVLLFSALSPAGASITFSHPEWLDTMVAEAEAKIQDRKQTKEMQLRWQQVIIWPPEKCPSFTCRIPGRGISSILLRLF